MRKNIHTTVLILGCLSITSCTNLDKEKPDSTVQWDFDHHVQFKQTTLAEKHYQLEIIPNDKVNFDHLATFLLRKSYSLCQHYNYQLEIVQGIEEFNDKRAMPNYIFPSLIANVECSSN